MSRALWNIFFQRNLKKLIADVPALLSGQGSILHGCLWLGLRSSEHPVAGSWEVILTHFTCRIWTPPPQVVEHCKIIEIIRIFQHTYM